MNMMEELRKPFLPGEIEWRIGRAGKKSDGKIWANALAYVTARAVRDRLDDVFGICGWREEYRAVADMPKEGIICRLWFKVGDEWLWREDGAQQTDIESFKGGISDSLKRAAASPGIGRYLYNLDETWVEVSPTGRKSADFPHYGALPKKDGGDAFYWSTPKLPAWALPVGVEPMGDRDTKGFRKEVMVMLEGCCDMEDLKDISAGFKDEANKIGEFDWLYKQYQENAARIEGESMDKGAPQ